MNVHNDFVDVRPVRVPGMKHDIDRVDPVGQQHRMRDASCNRFHQRTLVCAGRHDLPHPIGQLGVIHGLCDVIAGDGFPQIKRDRDIGTQITPPRRVVIARTSGRGSALPCGGANPRQSYGIHMVTRPASFQHRV